MNTIARMREVSFWLRRMFSRDNPTKCITNNIRRGTTNTIENHPNRISAGKLEQYAMLEF